LLLHLALEHKTAIDWELFIFYWENY